MGQARISDIAARASQALRAGENPEALHVLALIDLLAEPTAGKALQRSISSLQAAARMSDRPAPVLADLAAAYIARAERARTPSDLLAAIEAAEEALEREPRNRVALVNRALALQRFGLAAEAAREWRAYLEVDSMSAWAGEARRQLRATAATDGPPSLPAVHARPAVYAAYATADPQGARVLGWGRVLGAWANAVLEGAPGSGDESLRQATALGLALESRPGGDATLADAVRAISKAGGDHARELATAHREYSAGYALYDAVEFEASIPHFRAAARGAASSPTLRAWSRLFLGNALTHLGDETGEPMIREVAATADTARHAALAARARWSLAATLIRSDRYEAALAPARRSGELFRRSREKEHEGTALGVLSDAQFALGEMDAAYGSAHEAMALLHPYRASNRLHNVLFSLADAAATDGFQRAAVRVQDEGLDVAKRRGDPFFVVEARLARARLLAARGALALARRDVETARAELRQVTDKELSDWLEADLRTTEALAAPPDRRAMQSEALDSAARYYNAMGSRLRAFPVVVSAAEARLAAGDLAGGTGRLETAMAMLEQRRDSIQMEPRRAAVFESARGVVNRVVMLKLAAGHTAEALRTMDRGRASLAPTGREPQRPGGSVEGPAGEVVVEYALVGDTLLAWTVAGRDVALYRMRVDTARLVHTIRRLRSLLERESGERETSAALSQLYEWLLRPLGARLGPAGTPLAIVADGELASVPFAALRDARTAQYLIEERPIRFAVSLLGDRPATAHRSPGERGAAFVADPAFDPGEHPGLPRLAEAAAEARSIAATYSHPWILPDTQATRAAVIAALGNSSVVHYAGHAIFDDERPEQSYLVLAPVRGRTGSGTLTAAELARLRLSHAPLVVLAACQTVSSSRGRTGGFTGLAGALLAAGARGVVGGLWEVNDQRTRPLMTGFHRAYRARADGPAALRAAQLELIHSTDPALRSPAAWAGFRYAGR